MKLVLLPGMDGTGKLFAPFLRAVPVEQEVLVIAYPKAQPTEPERLVELIVSKLPNEPFVLLAESYSGALLYQVALRHPAHLKGVIFVATFLTCPYPLLLRCMRICGSIVPRISPPHFLVRLLMLGFKVDGHLVRLFCVSLQTVATNVLLQRMKHIGELQVPKQTIPYPCFLLQAQQDRLVPKSSIAPFRAIANHLHVYPVEGPHLILQAAPERCWAVVKEAIQSCSTKPPSCG